MLQAKIPKPNLQRTFGEVSYFGASTGELVRLDWSAQKCEMRQVHREMNPISAMAFDEQFVYTGSWDKRIFRCDRAALEMDEKTLFFERNDDPFAHSDYVKSLCVSQDQRFLFSGSGDGEVRRWLIPRESTEVTRYIKPLIAKFCSRFEV